MTRIKVYKKKNLISKMVHIKPKSVTTKLKLIIMIKIINIKETYFSEREKSINYIILSTKQWRV